MAAVDTTMTTGRTRKKVLILTQDDDGHAESLIAELEALGCPWARVDPASFPSQVSLIAHLADGDEWSSMLHLPNGELLCLEDVQSVWYRRPNQYTADAVLPSIERELIIQESQHGLGGLFRSIPGEWVNHPEANCTASYKPLQLQVARKLGFSVPRTLVTNSPEAFKQFYSECDGKVVYKLLGPSIFWDEEIPISAYTRLVPPEMLAEAHRLTKMAHLFQVYVDKLFELRITVIGERIFAAEIYSQHSEKARVDFRQQYADLRYGIHQLPEAIQTKIMALMRFFRLKYGAIDMIVTPEGEYQFIEINPNGQFAWIEAATDLPLFRTLAWLLATGQTEKRDI